VKNMYEKLGSDAAICQMHARLRELLGPNYVVSYDMHGLNRLHIYPKGKGFFARIIKIAEITGCGEGRGTIMVKDAEIYPQMKQFGDEFGFGCLEKCWLGADIERPDIERPAQPAKDEEKEVKKKQEMPRKREHTCDYLTPRYERIEGGKK